MTIQNQAFQVKPISCSKTSLFLEVEKEEPIVPALSFSATVALVALYFSDDV